MPPSKAHALKRDRQRILQAWFDPQNPQEGAVLQAFDELIRKTGRSPKELLGIGILTLAEGERISIPLPYTENAFSAELEQKIALMFDLLDKLATLVQSGRTAYPEFPEWQQVSGQIDEISVSIAEHYRPYRPD